MSAADDDLEGRLDADPRRLAAFVGGAAAAEHARALRLSRPVVVLEGPEVARAAPLLCEPPARLLVVVPCDLASAPRLPGIARTSLRNVIVVRFDDEPAGAAPFGEIAPWEPPAGSFAARVAERFAAAEEALRTDDHAAALEHTAAALDGVRACGDVRGQVLMLHKIAQLAGVLGDLDGATAALGEALGLEVAIDNPRGESYCRWPLADLALARGNPTAAVDHLERAIAIHEAEGLPTVEKLRAALAAARARIGATGAPAQPTAPADPGPLVALRRR